MVWTRSILVAAMLAAVLAGCGRNGAADHFSEGDRRFEAGEYAGAAEEYRAGLEMEPASAPAWNRLGMACRLQFNESRDSAWKEQELDAFRRAVAADSTYWPAYVNLGATLYYLGRKEEAFPLLQRALDLHPGNPDRQALEALLADTTALD